MKRIRDYADCADASYAMLHYVVESVDSIFTSRIWKGNDNVKLGDMIQRELNGEFKEVNTAYARCIEARFMKDVVLEKGVFKDTTIDNNPINIHIDSTLSTRTKNFVNRYELVEHCPNAIFGFSATLFKDTQAKDRDSKFILEIALNDLSIDVTLAMGDIPMQCYELARFYEEQIKSHLDDKQKLIITGHSLGGYLAQSFCFMYPNKVAELYTFNSPGLLGAWDKKFVDSLLKVIEVVSYAGAGITRKMGFKILAKSQKGLSIMATLGLLSLNINIKYAPIPKELQKYISTIKYLIKNIEDAENKDDYMPYPLNKNNHYHIEATNTPDFEAHISDTSFYVNLIQHLGKDIAGHYYPIYLGSQIMKSHFLSPMLNVLYFYSYLLELDTNNQTIQNATANRQSNKANKSNTSNHIDSTLTDYIQELNTFMDNLKTYTLTFIDTANEENTRDFNRKNAPFTLVRNKPESIGFFPYFLSQIAVIIGEMPNVLQYTQANYYERHKQVAISDEQIIDFIIKLCQKQLYINICNKEYFNKMRKDTQRINDKTNLGEKITLGTHRNFYVVNHNGACIENYESIVKVYGYKSDEYEITQQVWEEQYLGALCKVSQALYANGKAHIGIQYAK